MFLRTHVSAPRHKQDTARGAGPVARNKRNARTQRKIATNKAISKANPHGTQSSDTSLQLRLQGWSRPRAAGRTWPATLHGRYHAGCRLRKPQYESKAPETASLPTKAPGGGRSTCLMQSDMMPPCPHHAPRLRRPPPPERLDGQRWKLLRRRTALASLVGEQAAAAEPCTACSSASAQIGPVPRLPIVPSRLTLPLTCHCAGWVFGGVPRTADFVALRPLPNRWRSPVFPGGEIWLSG